MRFAIMPTGKESNILVVAYKDGSVENLKYGDKVKVSGALSLPENFNTNNGKEFDYVGYLKNKDIYYIIQNAKLEKISSGHGSFLKEKLFSFRNFFMSKINQSIKEPESFLANGLVLGERGGFDSRMRDKFINTGTIHIVALSGYNVSIVSDSIFKIFSIFLSKILSSFFGIFTIILFVVMSGSSATAVRAGIMASILFISRISGRDYNALRILFIAGVLMVVYDPRIFFDISFQLSFLATFGILYLHPLIFGHLKILTNTFKIREIFSTTISATIMTLPLLIYSTGILSLVSIPANMLILPVIPITMLFIFIGGSLGIFIPSVSIMFGYLPSIFLSYILKIIDIFSSFEFSSVYIYHFPFWATFLTYILIIYLCFRAQK